MFKSDVEFLVSSDHIIIYLISDHFNRLNAHSSCIKNKKINFLEISFKYFDQNFITNLRPRIYDQNIPHEKNLLLKKWNVYVSGTHEVHLHVGGKSPHSIHFSNIWKNKFVIIISFLHVKRDKVPKCQSAKGDKGNS